jgi:Domain of unknown function (DUF4286)
MYIYNVTIKLNWAIHDQWLQWMKETHIVDVMATNCFEKYIFSRLLETNEDEGPTYTVQYYCASKAIYNSYILKFAPKLRQDGFDKFGNSFIGFRSLLEICE